ncbi:hypothetical protein CPB86DRAFT_790576 [Serendipita vermifera]|nr:hypothetical protein CPB86DRAFT_790576 [Serendipita vermifera]
MSDLMLLIRGENYKKNPVTKKVKPPPKAKPPKRSPYPTRPARPLAEEALQPVHHITAASHSRTDSTLSLPNVQTTYGKDTYPPYPSTSSAGHIHIEVQRGITS